MWTDQVNESRERGDAVDQGSYISERLKDKQIPKLTKAKQALRTNIKDIQIDTGR